MTIALADTPGTYLGLSAPANAPVPGAGGGAPRRWLREALIVAAVLALCAAVVLRGGRGRWRTHLPGHNDTRMFVGVLQWGAEGLRLGRSWADLWQLPCLAPEPNLLACSEHMLGDAVLFAPLYFLTGQPILAFNLWLAAVVALNFLAAYLAARLLLRAWAPALLAAVLFTFGFLRLYHQGHYHLWPHFPTPLLFLIVVRLVERPGWRLGLLSGLCLAAQFWLSVYLGYMAAVMLAVMLVTLAATDPRRLADRRFLASLALGAAVAGLALLPLAGPYATAARRWGCWTWDETRAWLPGWRDLLLRGETEKSGYIGYLSLFLFTAGAVLLAARRRPGIGRWAAFAVVLPPAIACLAVNQFHSYGLLYRVLPGFQALRCPARIMLLALWPCGLVAGWAVRRLCAWAGPRGGMALGLGVTALVFAENAARIDYFDARQPEEAFYQTVVRSLPPGAVADFPLTRPGETRNWTMAERFAAVAAAGWRPALNAFTSRMPEWYYTLNARQLEADTPEKAAALMGELRLRGIRYVILHKDQTPPQRVGIWRAARCSAGRPWGRLAYDGPEAVLFDLDGAPREVRLPGAWAACQGTAAPRNGRRGSVVDMAGGGDGCAAFRPTMPLRPGRYRAVFEVHGESPAAVECAVVPLAPAGSSAAAVTHLPDLTGRQQCAIAFEVPQESGPEPQLEFRVTKSGGGRVVVEGVSVTAGD
jgi:hypothetical protein